MSGHFESDLSMFNCTLESLLWYLNSLLIKNNREGIKMLTYKSVLGIQYKFLLNSFAYFSKFTTGYNVKKLIYVCCPITDFLLRIIRRYLYN